MDTLSPPHGPTISEEAAVGPVPYAVHPGWRRAFPWLAHGITREGDPATPWDMALFGDGAAAPTLRRWQSLLDAVGMDRAVHARQVHGAAVRVHDGLAPGIRLAPDCDGHVTGAPGVLLAVTVADCVPVWLVHPRRRAVALLHAGWRGIAAGVLESGLAALRTRFGISAGELHLHLGPAICGRCYEVGPEVHDALGLPRPERPTPVDLRTLLRERAISAGVQEAHTTASAHCTRCGELDLFSHRRGRYERQVAFAGIRVGA